MSTIQEPHIRCKGKSPVDGCVEGAFPRGGAACVLFLLLDTGITPNFHDIFAAISEIVAFYTECDLKVDELLEEKIIMSQKKCRFCC